MIYGVDPGFLRVAVACPETGHVEEHKVRASTPHDQLSELTSWFHRALPGAAQVVMEAPIVGASGNAQTAVKLAMTVGALLPVRPTVLAAPSSWKAAVVGHGHASKDDVRAWLELHHPTLSAACGKSQDLVDACCLGLYGSRLARAGEVPDGAPVDLLRGAREQADEPRRGRPRKAAVRRVPRAAGLPG